MDWYGLNFSLLGWKLGICSVIYIFGFILNGGLFNNKIKVSNQTGICYVWDMHSIVYAISTD